MNKTADRKDEHFNVVNYSQLTFLRWQWHFKQFNLGFY